MDLNKLHHVLPPGFNMHIDDEFEDGTQVPEGKVALHGWLPSELTLLCSEDLDEMEAARALVKAAALAMMKFIASYDPMVLEQFYQQRRMLEKPSLN